MASKEIAIKVEHLRKSFRIPLESSNGIKQKLINIFKGRKGYCDFTPLEDISFEIEKGDFFGIVGRNGSGKSTLLKTIAGIYSPTDGLVQVNGSLVPFIELGVGFNPELTGRENVFLNGALLGFSHDEMEAMYDDIVDFAELHNFMDERLKNYSSGMQVRLAFSIAIRAQGDILLLDEVLAVGDEAFQQKCFTYFAELRKRKCTVILVTHDMGAVQRFCTKAMMIDKGKIVKIGNTAEVAGEYQLLNNRLASKKNKNKDKDSKFGEEAIDTKISMNNTGDSLIFNIDFKAKTLIEDGVVTVMMNNANGEAIYRWASDDDGSKGLIIREGETLNLKLELENIFPDGEFSIQLGVKKLDRSRNYALFNEALKFNLINSDIKKRNTHWKPKEKFRIKKA
ncbi:MAG: polysaccharide ABC transporter ATP-binding protein [Candidatus Nanogingivalaceae bacterium]|jgi:ABC-typepolysaccharide/polyolphosphate transport system, ATPase component|nr:polysaccharide ABC transporter ATP-binding protein [Candidatus Nanogingivalaceae bacterium]